MSTHLPQAARRGEKNPLKALARPRLSVGASSRPSVSPDGREVGFASHSNTEAAHSGLSVLVRRRGAVSQYRPFAFSSARSAFVGPPWHDAGFTLASYPVPSSRIVAAIRESFVAHQFSGTIAGTAFTVAPPWSKEQAT